MRWWVHFLTELKFDGKGRVRGALLTKSQFMFTGLKLRDEVCRSLCIGLLVFHPSK